HLLFRDIQEDRHLGKGALFEPAQRQQAMIQGRYLLGQIRKHLVQQLAVPARVPLLRRAWTRIGNLAKSHASAQLEGMADFLADEIESLVANHYVQPAAQPGAMFVAM